MYVCNIIITTHTYTYAHTSEKGSWPSCSPKHERVGPGRLTVDGCAYVGEERQERSDCRSTIRCRPSARFRPGANRFYERQSADQTTRRGPSRSVSSRSRRQSQSVHLQSQLCGRRVESAHGAPRVFVATVRTRPQRSILRNRLHSANIHIPDS